MDPMDTFQVVTCFLRRNGKVLLLQRSTQVRTFPGRWAAVSGGLEQDVLDQAYQEIEEECGYRRDQVRLVGGGEPIEATGEGRVFHVHPLLFEVLTDQEPRLNWENNAWRWVEPGDIAQYDTVPRLWETWQRVASPAKNQDASPAR